MEHFVKWSTEHIPAFRSLSKSEVEEIVSQAQAETRIIRKIVGGIPMFFVLFFGLLIWLRNRFIVDWLVRWNRRSTI